MSERRLPPTSAQLDRLEEQYRTTGLPFLGRLLAIRLRDHGNYEGYARKIEREIYNSGIYNSRFNRIMPQGNPSALPQSLRTNPSGLPESEPHPADYHSGGSSSYSPLPPGIQTSPSSGDIHSSEYHAGGPGPYLPPSLRTGK